MKDGVMKEKSVSDELAKIQVRIPLTMKKRFRKWLIEEGYSEQEWFRKKIEEVLNKEA